jgi:hypothetical protein
MPLLRGTDDEQEMSRSYDNYVGISQAAVQAEAHFDRLFPRTRPAG